eukprot:31229-Pelagococcus_subviridis.AAC.6
MRRAKSLRNRVHHAIGVVWGPVYRTHLIHPRAALHQTLRQPLVPSGRRRHEQRVPARVREVDVHGVGVHEGDDFLPRVARDEREHLRDALAPSLRRRRALVLVLVLSRRRRRRLAVVRLLLRRVHHRLELRVEPAPAAGRREVHRVELLRHHLRHHLLLLLLLLHHHPRHRRVHHRMHPQHRGQHPHRVVHQSHRVHRVEPGVHRARTRDPPRVRGGGRPQGARGPAARAVRGGAAVAGSTTAAGTAARSAAIRVAAAAAAARSSRFKLRRDRGPRRHPRRAPPINLGAEPSLHPATAPAEVVVEPSRRPRAAAAAAAPTRSESIRLRERVTPRRRRASRRLLRAHGVEPVPEFLHVLLLLKLPSLRASRHAHDVVHGVSVRQRRRRRRRRLVVQPGE